MAFTSGPTRTFNEINITPLTDVFLVLLVVMILVAPLTSRSVLKVSAPQAASPIDADPDRGKDRQINVCVNAGGGVSINGTAVHPVNTQTIQSSICAEQKKAGSKDLILNLSSEQEALHKNVVAVMDAAAGAQIKQLRIISLKR